MFNIKYKSACSETVTGFVSSIKIQIWEVGKKPVIWPNIAKPSKFCWKYANTEYWWG